MKLGRMLPVTRIDERPLGYAGHRGNPLPDRGRLVLRRMVNCINILMQFTILTTHSYRPAGDG